MDLILPVMAMLFAMVIGVIVGLDLVVWQSRLMKELSLVLVPLMALMPWLSPSSLHSNQTGLRNIQDGTKRDF